MDLAAVTVRVPAAEVISEVFDGEVVVVQLRTGVYYTIPATHTEYWTAFVAGSQPPAVLHAMEGAGVAESASSLVDFLTWGHGEGVLVLEPVPANERGAADPPWGITRFDDMADLMMADPIHDVDYDGEGWHGQAS
jgi:hypothetical protein